jgi:hypothetical protein
VGREIFTIHRRRKKYEIPGNSKLFFGHLVLLGFSKTKKYHIFWTQEFENINFDRYILKTLNFGMYVLKLSNIGKNAKNILSVTFCE